MLDFADNSVEIKCNDILQEVNNFKDAIQTRLISLMECKKTMMK